MRLKTRNLGGFISLVFQNTVSKIKAVTDFDACFSQFCDYTYESFIKPSLVASEFTQYLTENKIIYDKNDKMLLDVKLSLNEKYKNESCHPLTLTTLLLHCLLPIDRPSSPCDSPHPPWCPHSSPPSHPFPIRTLALLRRLDSSRLPPDVLFRPLSPNVIRRLLKTDKRPLSQR